MNMKFFKTKIFLLFFVVVFSVRTLAVPPGWPEDGVIVEPEMNREPFVRVIQDAQKSLDIAAYRLTDDLLISELSKATQRGVRVTVIVTREMYKSECGAEAHENSLKVLREAGLNVLISPALYTQAHHKMILVDNEYALIGTGNLGGHAFEEIEGNKAQRDFWVTVTDPGQVNELREVFAADLEGRETHLTPALLVWGPDQGRAPFIELINSAQNSIWVYQADIQDKEIADVLVAAAERGIDVRLIMSPFPYNKNKDGNIPNQERLRRAGGQVGLVNHVLGHAKVVLVDVETDTPRTWVGSTNFYPPSLDENRELGIIISDPRSINKIRSVFKADWNQANFIPRE